MSQIRNGAGLTEFETNSRQIYSDVESFKLRRFVFLRRPAAERDGGTIYDDRVLAVLREVVDSIRIHEIPKASAKRAILRSLSTGLSPTNTRYQPSNSLEAIDESEELVISHEGLSSIQLDYVRLPRIWVILHNLPSGFDDERRVSKRNLLKPLSRISDGRLMRQKNVIPVVLSRREVELVNQLGSFQKPRLIQPGMPPYDSTQPVIQGSRVDLVISGTFDWSVKKRDADWLKDQILCHLDASDDHLGALYADPSFNTSFSRMADIDSLPQDGKLRLGVVPDRFLSGMKLKVLWYIAQNCAVAAPCNLREEFAGIPHAEKFIHCFSTAEQLQSIIRQTAQVAPDEFRAFKKACTEVFSWRKQVLGGFSVEGT